MLLPVGVLIVLLSLSGNISRTLKSAKEGLKEATTPLGFIILVALIYIAYKVYLIVMATL
jgi:hypothetical protein